MARVNKTTDGVFSKFFGGEKTIPAYDAFLNNNNPKFPSPNLRKYMKLYKDYIANEKLYLEQIALVEEIVMQYRSKEQITDMKISFVRGYIYARCPFYRRGKTAKDVRVIADNVEFWNMPLKKLVLNEEFMKKAKDKLTKKMLEHIDENIEKLAVLQEEIKILEEAKIAARKLKEAQENLPAPDDVIPPVSNQIKIKSKQNNKQVEEVVTTN